jgi:hypothetical protein
MTRTGRDSSQPNDPLTRPRVNYVIFLSIWVESVAAICLVRVLRVVACVIFRAPGAGPVTVSNRWWRADVHLREVTAGLDHI